MEIPPTFIRARISVNNVRIRLRTRFHNPTGGPLIPLEPVPVHGK